MASFVFKFFVALGKGTGMPAAVASAGEAYVNSVTTGTQQFKTVLPDDHPGRIPMPKTDAGEQASGQVKFTDDMQPSNPFYAVFVQYTKAPALITGIDASDALKMPGVIDFVGAADIPAFNCTSPFAPMEEFLFPIVYKEPAAGTSDADIATAKKAATVLFVGQPVGLIVAKSRREAEAAAKCVNVTSIAEQG
jgi:CO/xanthine dehydrogenase Mo-binding subunit